MKPDRPLPDELISQIPLVRDEAYAALTRAPAATPGLRDLSWLTPLRRQIGRLEVPLVRIRQRMGLFLDAEPANLATLRYWRDLKDQAYPLPSRERQVLDRQMDLKEAVDRADVDAVGRCLETFEGPARAVAVDLVLRQGAQELHDAIWPQIQADIEAKPFLEWVTQGLQKKTSSEAAWRLAKLAPRVNPQDGIPTIALIEAMGAALQRHPEPLIHSLLSLAYPQGEILPEREAKGMLNMIRGDRPTFLLEFWTAWTQPASRQAWLQAYPGQLPELEALVRSLNLQERPATPSSRPRRRS